MRKPAFISKHFCSAIMFFAVAMALLSAALPTALAQRGNSVISDGGDFFSTGGKTKAAEIIASLESKYHVPVRVETFATLPSGKAERAKDLSPKERAEFFSEWLKELAHAEGAKGVFILACRGPGHLRVGVSKELHRRGLTDADRDAISDRMLEGFQEKNYDAGLTNALTLLMEKAQRLKAHDPSAKSTNEPGGKSGSSINWPTSSTSGGHHDPNTHSRSAPAPVPVPQRRSSSGWGFGGLLCLLVVGFILLMVVLNIWRFFSRMMGGGMANRGNPGPGGPGYGGGFGGGGYGGGYGGGGGSIFGGLLSGLGGAMLGNWMYDRWSGGGHSGGFGGGSHEVPTDYTGGGGSSFGDSGQDFGSSGGDFGGGSSGGDFGGGGGGFGGGGGDFGGGGDSGGGDGGGDF